MLIICLKHTLSASVCIIAYELNFCQMEMREGEHGKEGREDRYHFSCAQQKQKVKSCRQAAPKTRVPGRALSHGSEITRKQNSRRKSKAAKEAVLNERG